MGLNSLSNKFSKFNYFNFAIGILVPFLITSCTNSSPTIKQLGSISGKIEITSPADLKANITDQADGIFIQGTCDADILRMEVLGHDGVYRDFSALQSLGTGTVDCKNTQTFSIDFTAASAIAGENLNSDIKIRGFSKAYETNPLTVTVIDKTDLQVSPIKLTTAISQGILSTKSINSSDDSVGYKTTHKKEFFTNRQKIGFSGTCAGVGRTSSGQEGFVYQVKPSFIKFDGTGGVQGSPSSWTACSSSKTFSYPSSDTNAMGVAYGNGIYTYEITQKNTDLPGKAVSEKVTLVFYVKQATPTTISITSPANNIYTNSAISIVGDCEYDNENRPTRIVVGGSISAIENTNANVSPFLLCDSTGHFTFTTDDSNAKPSTNSSVYNYTFVQQDYFENESSAATFTWNFDKTPPTAVTANLPNNGSNLGDSGLHINGANITGNNYLDSHKNSFFTQSTQVTFTGSGCESGRTVTLEVGGAGSNTATCSGGNFSILSPSVSGNNSYQVDIYQTDRAGNTSEHTLLFWYSDQSSSPPNMNGIVEGTAGIGDGIEIISASTTQKTINTNELITGLTISGSNCEAGASLQLKKDSVNLGPAIECSSSGNYSFPFASNPSDGLHIYTVNQVDLAGNTSGVFTLNWTKIPEPITFTEVVPGNIAVTTPSLNVSGTCTTGYTVSISIPAEGATYDRSFACSGGNFDFRDYYELDDGDYSVVFIQTYNSTDSPAATLTWKKRTQRIAAGGNHTCAIGPVKGSCWGSDAFGNIGDGDRNGDTIVWDVDTANPQFIVETANWASSQLGTNNLKKVSAGNDHSCAINQNNELFCWGRSDSGQNGSNGLVNTSSPKKVPNNLSTETYLSVSAGGYHTCAIRSDKALECWGKNSTKQIGNNLTTDSDSPVTISSFWASNVSAGLDFTCATKTDNSLYCWGNNSYGNLGDNSTNTRGVPTLIDSGTTYASVSAGGYHACGITLTGDLKCWGDNSHGQLGLGNYDQKLTPQIVESGTKFVSVAAGRQNTCAITVSGVLKCWGNNLSTQIVNDSTQWYTSPITIGNNYKYVTSGYRNICAMDSSNVLKCWGYNANLQSGDSNTADIPVNAKQTVTLP